MSLWIVLIIILIPLLLLLIVNVNKNKWNKEQQRREELRKKKEEESLSYTRENLRSIRSYNASAQSYYVSDTVLSESMNRKTQSNNFADHKKINCAITGLSYRTYSEKQRAKKLYIDEEVFLQREENNQYDKHATRVITKDGVFVGYVDSNYSNSVAMRIRERFDIRCFVSKITNDDLPFIYMDIYYKSTFDRKKENTYEAVISKKYLEYDLNGLIDLKWDIDRFDVRLEDGVYEDLLRRISDMYDDAMREKIRCYSFPKLSAFLKTKEGKKISNELRKEIEAKLSNESDSERLIRECENIKSKIRRLKRKDELSDISELEDELNTKYMELNRILLSEYSTMDLPDDVLELKKMQNNWRTKILKAECKLNYQSESKKGKELNPMPEGYERTMLEGKIEILKKEKEYIDSKINKML